MQREGVQSHAEARRAMAFSTEMTGPFCCQAWECEILFAPLVMLDTPNDA